MLVQVVIRSADLVSGKVRVAMPYYTYCDVNVIAIQYCDTDNSQHTHLIQLKSDLLTMSQSPTPYLTFIAQSGSNLITFADTRIHFKDILLNGNLVLEPINVATGTTPANFSNLVLTLDVNPKLKI